MNPFTRFRRKRPLDASGRLASSLWIDRRNSDRILEKKRSKGEISAEEAENLAFFVKNGYLKLSTSLSEGTCEAIQEDVEALWRERPDYVAYSYRSLLTRFSDARVEHRQPAYRIADLHSYSRAARELYLSPEIFRYIELLFGEPGVATQSLYFEWGSQQPLHRDPVFVRMQRPSHLLAAWVALEDIGPDCGPLVYVPGSHRLPYYQYEPGRFFADFSRDSDADRQRAEAWDQAQCDAHGLRPELLTCRRGDCLIWHHSLLHGGAPPTDPSLTRKSFVVHYSTFATMKKVQNSYLEEPHSSDSKIRSFTSDVLLEENRCRGFASPLEVRGSLAEEAEAK